MPGTSKWTSPTGPTPPLLWMVVVSLLFGGIVGAVAIAEEDEPSETVAAGETTDDDGADDSDGNGGVGPGADDSSSAGGSDPLSDPAALDQQPTQSGNQANVVPGGQAARPDSQVAVTPAGSYKYRTTIEGDDGGTEDHTLTVSDTGPNQQKHSRSGGGGGFAFDTQVTWTPEAMQLTGASASGQSCTYNPPFTQLVRKLELGTSWESESTCQGGGATVKTSISASVKETATVDLGGTQVPAWVIEFTLITDFSSPFGSFNDRAQGRLWVDPTRALDLRREAQHDVTGTDSEGNTEKSSYSELTVLTG